MVNAKVSGEMSGAAITNSPTPPTPPELPSFKTGPFRFALTADEAVTHAPTPPPTTIAYCWIVAEELRSVDESKHGIPPELTAPVAVVTGVEKLGKIGTVPNFPVLAVKPSATPPALVSANALLVGITGMNVLVLSVYWKPNQFCGICVVAAAPG